MLWLLKGSYKLHLQIVRGPELGNGCSELLKFSWLRVILKEWSINPIKTQFLLVIPMKGDNI
jgi:hypothetical protein